MWFEAPESRNHVEGVIDEEIEVDEWNGGDAIEDKPLIPMEVNADAIEELIISRIWAVVNVIEPISEEAISI